MSIKYKIFILITLLITVINIKADGISTTLDTISVKTEKAVIYVDTSSNFKHVYEDVKSGIIGLAKDIYLTKKAEAEEIRTKAKRKAFKQKILGLIVEKQEDSLKGKSIEEFTAMLNA